MLRAQLMLGMLYCLMFSPNAQIATCCQLQRKATSAHNIHDHDLELHKVSCCRNQILAILRTASG
jgi:hypothetical protein